MMVNMPTGDRHAEMIAWYERKTPFLLDKYGGRGRVHYHTGLFAPEQTPANSLEGLRDQIWQSQEDMLACAAIVWDARRCLAGRDVLDVGCGLGGGPLYWAQTFGARVTALTPVP